MKNKYDGFFEALAKFIVLLFFWFIVFATLFSTTNIKLVYADFESLINAKFFIAQLLAFSLVAYFLTKAESPCLKKLLHEAEGEFASLLTHFACITLVLMLFRFRFDWVAMLIAATSMYFAMLILMARKDS